MDVNTIQCPNCSSTKNNRFCSVCGQNDRDYSQSLLSVVVVAFRETFEMDSRVAKTLVGIVAHPGSLSAEFAKNKRASYVTPFRLYLFTSILCFFTISFVPNPPDIHQDDPTVKIEPDWMEIEIETPVDDTKAVAVDTKRLQDLLNPSHQKMLQQILKRDDGSPGKAMIVLLASEVPEDATRDDMQIRIFGAFIEIFDSPKNAMSRLVDNLPLMMFVLLPWFTFLLALFYFGKHFQAIYHLVFALHIHSFGFLLFSAGMLIGLLIPQARESAEIWQTVDEAIQNLVILIFLGHSWIAFRSFYEQSIIATTFKCLGIWLCYLLMLGPAFLLVVGFTIFQFM